MSMRQNSRASIWHALNASGDLAGRFLCAGETSLAIGTLINGSALGGRGGDLLDRSVLLATADQFTAALALIELDGIARRLILCPPDFALEHLPFVIDAGAVEAILWDETAPKLNDPEIQLFPCTSKIVPAAYDRRSPIETEWILLTSGTTGLPKLAVHTLASLAAAIDSASNSNSRVVWSTFYDIRRYGGLQILLRALLAQASLVLPGANESMAGFLTRAGARGITHISGTPSHWRLALMSPSAQRIAPEYVRLSGEIADQTILDQLRAFYPQARISHAFATTEAGVAFDVTDGLAGFPASMIGRNSNVELKVEDDMLWIRSSRTARRYLGAAAGPLKDQYGFVNTGDMLELRNGRYYFAGRRDGVINVGGLKVHPEEVEAVINRHPRIQMSVVRSKKNPITGAIVIADVVLKRASDSVKGRAYELEHDILSLCRSSLSPYKVPAKINFVPSLALTEAGKLIRHNA